MDASTLSNPIKFYILYNLSLIVIFINNCCMFFHNNITTIKLNLLILFGIFKKLNRINHLYYFTFNLKIIFIIKIIYFYYKYLYIYLK